MSLGSFQSTWGKVAGWTTILLALAGVAGFAAIFVSRPSFTVPVSAGALCLIPIVAWLIWKGGEAWVRSAGPEIEMDDLECEVDLLTRDEYQVKRTYFVKIRNVGAMSCVPCVFLKDLSHPNSSIKGWRAQMQAHWRDRPPSQSVTLSYKGAQEMAGLLLADWSEYRDFSLHLYPLDQKTTQLWIDPKKPLLATVVAYCETQDKVRGNEIVRRFILTPEDGHGGYAITRDSNFTP